MHHESRRIALITGAGRGIGKGAALALARVGYNVVLVSRTSQDLEVVGAEIEAAGGSAEIAVCDILDTPALTQLFAQLPWLDVLINNAGTNRPASLVDVLDADLDAVLSLNVRANILVAREALRKMLQLPAEVRAAGAASIINITSQMGRVGAAQRTIYCASKHAMEGFTKALAIELAPTGIRVNAVAPTFLDTPMTAPFFAKDPAFYESVVSRIPMGRLGSVEEVADVIAFLASPAARFITGESIAVDGGWTAQ
jgi:NAD(P)-dependent dehydrogenase (short-subunit alcohol dehydrogenase family)